MTFKISKTAQVLSVYNFHADTKEFIGISEIFIPPHTGLPALCTEKEPPEIFQDMAAIFDVKKQKWFLIEDYRGKIFFDTLTGLPIIITKLGALQENTTTVAPDDQYQKWDGSGWVIDHDAKKHAIIQSAEKEKISLINNATLHINVLQDAVDLETASLSETEKLKEWKKYRVKISHINTSEPDEIEWPELPI